MYLEAHFENSTDCSDLRGQEVLFKVREIYGRFKKSCSVAGEGGMAMPLADQEKKTDKKGFSPLFRGTVRERGLQ